jgi:hypothetical protein
MAIITEKEKRELITKLVAAVNELANKSYVSKANYMMIPEENIQKVADNLGISKEQAVQVLREYFSGQIN